MFRGKLNASSVYFSPSLAFTDLTLEEETEDKFINLLDFDLEPCEDGEALLRNIDHYRVDLDIPHNIENGIITVYFNQTVDCRRREVLC